jgi:hypothetical protein
MTWTVVACDIAISILFLANMLGLYKYTELAQIEDDKDNVELTDFAVTIKNLPD